MDYKDLTSILIKTAAAVMLFWFLAALPNAIISVMYSVATNTGRARLAGMDAWTASILTLLPSIFGIGLSWLAFLFPRSLANKLIPGAVLTTQPQLVAQLQYVALRLVGLFYIYRSVVDFAYYIARVYVRNAQYLNAGYAFPRTWDPADGAGLASTAVELLLAFWLVLGARGILNIFDRLRGTTCMEQSVEMEVRSAEAQ